jgi:predicted N-acetyltransferase YhbS
MLVRAGLERCRELGYVVVALIGHPTYYPRFGFAAASRIGLTCNIPVPDEVFMAHAIRAEDVMAGNLVYPQAFFF